MSQGFNLLQRGYPCGGNAKYLECGFVYSKPIFQSGIKRTEEELGSEG